MLSLTRPPGPQLPHSDGGLASCMQPFTMLFHASSFLLPLRVAASLLHSLPIVDYSQQGGAITPLVQPRAVVGRRLAASCRANHRSQHRPINPVKLLRPDPF